MQGLAFGLGVAHSIAGSKDFETTVVLELTLFDMMEMKAYTAIPSELVTSRRTGSVAFSSCANKDIFAE